MDDATAARLARLQERRRAVAAPGRATAAPARGSDRAASIAAVPDVSREPPAGRRRPAAGASRALVAGLSTSGTFLMVAAMVHSGQRAQSRTVQFTTDTTSAVAAPVTPSTIYRIIYRQAPAGAVAAGANQPGLGGPARPAPGMAKAAGPARSTGGTPVAAGGPAATGAPAPSSASPAGGPVPATAPPKPAPVPTTAAPKPAPVPTTAPAATSCGSHC